MMPVGVQSSAQNLLESDATQFVDEHLFKRATTQWLFADWKGLTTTSCDLLLHHPDRANLALLIAAGHQKLGNFKLARKCIRLAVDWGCSRKLIAQVLIADAHDTLAIYAAMSQDVSKSLHHFSNSAQLISSGRLLHENLIDLENSVCFQDDLINLYKLTVKFSVDSEGRIVAELARYKAKKLQNETPFERRLSFHGASLVQFIEEILTHENYKTYFSTAKILEDLTASCKTAADRCGKGLIGDELLAILQVIRKYKTDKAGLFELLAKVHERREEYVEAERALFKSFELDPISTKFVYLSTLKRKSVRSGFSAASKALQRVIEAGIDSHKIRLEYATVLTREKRFRLAIEVLHERTHDISESMIEIPYINFLASLYFSVGQPNRAIEVIEKLFEKEFSTADLLMSRILYDEFKRSFIENKDYDSKTSIEILEEASKFYYDAVYETSPTYRSPSETSVYSPVWNEVIGIIASFGATLVCDIGCGPGQFAEVIKKKLPDIRYIGIDFSSKAIKMSIDKKLGFDFLCEDIMSFSYSNLNNDSTVYLMLEVLEHLQADRDLLGLVPAGEKIIFTVPNFYSLGHVRFFVDKAKIIERYDSLIELQDITEVTLGIDSVIYTCRGVRRH